MRRDRLFAAVAVLALVACSSRQPIENFPNVPVARYDGSALNEDMVRQAIIRGAASKGWVVAQSGTRELTATLNLRSHQAVIRIAYTARDYSITYQNSHHLEAANGKIHKNYNRWLANLNQAIAAELQRI